MASLPTNWWDLSGEPRVRATYTAELRKECGDGHVLAGRDAKCFAKCEGCDRAVYALDGDQWALVHLTFTKSPPESDPQWPTVEAIGPWDEVLSAMTEHSRRHDE
jgi:hypothetical protein